GQGLSVVIQTQHHLLIYDAGPRLSATTDMGERIVVPYLRTLGAHKIDMMVISHGDNDHIGGSAAILQAYTVKTLKTSVPERLPAAQYCLAGDTWHWDQVRFSFLYPESYQLGLGNNSSCVLQIDNGKYRILLTGDIEKFAEHQLVRKPISLTADVVIAP